MINENVLSMEEYEGKKKLLCSIFFLIFCEYTVIFVVLFCKMCAGRKDYIIFSKKKLNQTRIERPSNSARLK